MKMVLIKWNHLLVVSDTLPNEDVGEREMANKGLMWCGLQQV
jgi:hypothetical protein